VHRRRTSHHTTHQQPMQRRRHRRRRRRERRQTDGSVLSNVSAVSQHPELKGRRVLVTGASRGIGGECARLLAELGATVVAVARGRAAVEDAVAGLPGEGHRAVALDVGDENGWRAAAETGALEGIDGLVTAAAVLAPVGPVGSYAPEEFWATMRVNVLGTLLAVHHCLSSLEAARGRADRVPAQRRGAGDHGQADQRPVGYVAGAGLPAAAARGARPRHGTPHRRPVLRPGLRRS
jgi:NAD(P)-dependent dehydrogenase (short-subunit alcohol dehydrogenase family)